MFDKIRTEFQTTIEKKPQTARLLIAGAAVLLLGVSGAILFNLIRRTPVGNAPIGSNVIPENAWVAISLSNDNGAWQRLRQMGTPESRALLEEQIKTWQSELFNQKGYDFAKDIQPWLERQWMLAGMPADSTSNSPQPTLIILPIGNNNRAKDWYKTTPQPATERIYNKTNFKEFQINNNKVLITLLEDKFGLISNDQKTLEKAIDTYKGGKSIITIPGYNEALNKLQKTPEIAHIFLNVPVANTVAAMNSVRPIPPQNIQKLQLQGIATDVIIEPEGVRFNGNYWLKPDSDKKQKVENNAKSMSAKLPANTLMMISGTNLENLWQDYAENAKANPLTPMSPQWLQNGINATLGLNLEKDLLAWMAGDFSLSLIPDTAKTNPQFPSSLLLMVHSNNRRAGDEAFKKLDEVMKTKYRYKVEETKVNDQTVVNWTSPYGGITLTRGWLGGNIAFLSLGARVTNTFQPRPQTPLAASETFQKSMTSQLENPGGQIFIDLQQIIDTKQFFLPQLPPSSQAVLGAIKTIGLTTSVVNEKSTDFDMLIRMRQETKPTLPAPKATPQPTPSPQKK